MQRPASMTKGCLAPDRHRHPGLARWRAAALLLAATVVAATVTSAGAAPAGRALPAEAVAALARAQVPASALAVVVHDASSRRAVLAFNADKPVNPASLMKLLTTAAALDRLGPAYTWATPVWLAGSLRDGVLEGSVHIKGSGDPKLVLERVWLLLRRLQQAGVREIRGDIVLDNSAFALAAGDSGDAGDFDAEPLKPYNVKPSALLMNFRSLQFGFLPDAAAGVARVTAEPPLAGHVFERSVPLLAGACGDWRSALKASFEPGRSRFAGGYALACGEGSWAVADPQPATFEARLLEGLWRELGGTLTGSVREGPAPADRPSFELRSPALAEVVRDINKFSNNVMAQQLFLTLGLGTGGAAASVDSARAVLLRWLGESSGLPLDDVVIDNGSGLSRLNRISAERLARVLLRSWDGASMSELMASLPASGLDGTLRRSHVASGRAHLKTGTLRDVVGVAGYVLSNSGLRYVLVAVVNHPNAGAARPVLEALTQWVARDAPAR